MVTHIESERDLLAGMAHLQAVCPTLRAVIAATGVPPLRRREGGFAGLAAIIIGQQVSVASAQAIHSRVERALGGMQAAAFAAASDEALRAAGLSGPKLRTLRAAAIAAVEGRIDFDRLADAPVDQVHATLTALPGIGPWTADVYALFCLGHGDAFAPGDLAMQEAARLLFRLKQRPAEDVFLALAEHWRPWRGVAARLLWAYYALAKSREGAIGRDGEGGDDRRTKAAAARRRKT